MHLNWAGANHDESIFDSPDEIDIDRKPNRHLGFGVGIHLCLGIHMARTIMRVALEESLATMHRIRISGLEDVVETAGTTWGLSRLPLVFDPVADPRLSGHGTETA